MSKDAAPSVSTLRHGLSEAKRSQILAGARIVFLEDGFEGASMDRVAREAGVSKGTLYNYFQSKEFLFTSLIQDDCVPVAADRADMSNYSEDPARLLGEFGIQCIQRLLDPNELALFRIVLAEVMKFPELGRTIERHGPGNGVQILSGFLQTFHERGILHIPDPRLAAEQFMGLCDAGMIRRLQLSAEIPTQAQVNAQVESAVKLFLRGYAIRADNEPN